MSKDAAYYAKASRNQAEYERGRNAEQADEKNWTRCTRECRHSGPYRVYYRSGQTALVTTEGCAQAGWSLTDPALVLKVTAPHAPPSLEQADV